VIQRAIERDGKFLFGAEFIVRVASYPKIVQFVYGGTLDMLRHIATQVADLVAQGGRAVEQIIAHVMDIVGMILVFLFLNKESEIKERLSAWIQEGDAHAGLAERMVKAAVIALTLGFLHLDEETRQNYLLILKRLLPTEELQHNRRILKRGWLRVVKSKAFQEAQARARLP
jgi:hypothetical protein